MTEEIRTEAEDEKVVEQKKFTKEDIVIYKPKTKNINFAGEWLMRLGGFVYGIIIPEATKKVKVTYNIEPDNIHVDHFDEVWSDDIPQKVYEMVMKKVNADISRIDSMMYNIIKNKEFLSLFFSYAEANKTNGNTELDDVQEYTEEDAQKDKQMEQSKIIDAQRKQASIMKQPDARNKIKARRAKAKAARKGWKK